MYDEIGRLASLFWLTHSHCIMQSIVPCIFLAVITGSSLIFAVPLPLSIYRSELQVIVSTTLKPFTALLSPLLGLAHAAPCLSSHPFHYLLLHHVAAGRVISCSSTAYRIQASRPPHQAVEVEAIDGPNSSNT